MFKWIKLQYAKLMSLRKGMTVYCIDKKKQETLIFKNGSCIESLPNGEHNKTRGNRADLPIHFFDYEYLSDEFIEDVAKPFLTLKERKVKKNEVKYRSRFKRL